MFISLLTIDIGKDPDRPQPGRQWLRNRYHVHQRLCMAFPSKDRKSKDPDFLKPFQPEDFDPKHGENQKARIRNKEDGFLFRVDPSDQGQSAILVQSAIIPDWGYAFHNALGFLAALPRVKEFTLAPHGGNRYRFRLFANPTRKIKTKTTNGQKQNGKRVPVDREKLADWLHRRAKSAGFLPVQDSLHIQPGYTYMQKKGVENGQHIFSVLYEGVLEVENPLLLQEALISGIGPAKAFGFGLLSLAPFSE